MAGFILDGFLFSVARRVWPSHPAVVERVERLREMDNLHARLAEWVIYPEWGEVDPWDDHTMGLTNCIRPEGPMPADEEQGQEQEP
ncbi:hypothetical protein KBY58_09770 [Cyanobium sp. HWJ4-Hawea]|uniref:hypothetical protein n=1 Tax=Cyanobium sp. HWJ4-Hawea TaxID=2823713 RepID=UPI0020CD11BB|nr:hypothetical protein [Cyanobium sp. HWJ4-Hawea]MCP9809719.1 hypothetical protein [Cyanobium sp. HWJ4-Hawea]